LNNGLRMPVLGLGTYRIYTQHKISEVLHWAVNDLGYRMIDTAKYYENEQEIGHFMKKCSIPREEMFLVSKLWPDDHGHQRTVKAFERTLENLKVDYLDLYMVHWPGVEEVAKDPKDRAEAREIRASTWQAMEEIYKTGKAKAIGVSNYMIRHLKELSSYASVEPSVNQVEFHPYLYQRELLQYCAENKIQMEAYSSLGKGELLKDKRVLDLAKKYNRTAAQILLRWAMQHSVVVIPKAAVREKLEENSKVFDFELAADDMIMLNALDKGWHCTWDPSHVI
jgi:diketogulonate reductase-like aldo/keto reductase